MSLAQRVPPNDETEVPCKGKPYEVDFAPLVREHNARTGNEMAKIIKSLGKTSLQTLCSGCPIENHLWCLSEVRPTATGFTGVAGNRIWFHGRRIG